MGVELSSTVVRLNVDLGLVDEADDLEVAGGLHVLDTGKGTSGDDAGALAGLGAPGDLETLGVSDGLVGGRGSPETEVVEVVEEAGLTERVCTLGGRVTLVVTLLRATVTIGGVDLVGLAGGQNDVCVVAGGRNLRGRGT